MNITRAATAAICIALPIHMMGCGGGATSGGAPTGAGTPTAMPSATPAASPSASPSSSPSPSPFPSPSPSSSPTPSASATPTPSATPSPSPVGNNGLQLESATPTTVLLRWSTVAGTADYRIVRNGQQRAQLEDTQVRFRDTNLAPSSTYTYVIEALSATGALLSTRTLTVRSANGNSDLGVADLPPADAQQARSYTTFGWTPMAPFDTCSKQLHDAYWTFGPDNKVYPTWHPPVYEFADGTTCTFGHEHGQDPRQARIFTKLAPLPFGYVNEQLSPNDTSLQRNEDHYGHKIEFSNGLPSQSGPTCDVLNKFHMGTHGPDAFANNTHEIFVNLDCSNGISARWKSLHAMGQSGTIDLFSRRSAADTTFNSTVGTARTPNPSDQPYWEGRRLMPSLEAMENGTALADMLRGGESWVAGIGMYVRGSDGQLILAFGAEPYWRTQNPARLFDPSSTNSLKRWIDLCYVPASLSYSMETCVTARARSAQPMAWNSPLSPLRGTVRAVDLNSTVSLVNTSGTRYWYAHPYAFDYANQIPRPVTSRSQTHPIRLVFALTSGSNLLEIQHLFNFAGEIQDGNGLPFFDFGKHQLKNGQVIDSGVHAPN